LVTIFAAWQSNAVLLHEEKMKRNLLVHLICAALCSFYAGLVQADGNGQGGGDHGGHHGGY
jgi:hypothetical protein